MPSAMPAVDALFAEWDRPGASGSPAATGFTVFTGRIRNLRFARRHG